ncbi:MAG TPA: hypothetical protein VME43_25965 [Bryobacteraceae bacterium]|nr:hypothetical protein [Bryobacteraceae bacterium]
MNAPLDQPFEVQVECTNTGQAVWLDQQAYKNMGSVRSGPHLYDANRRLLQFELVAEAIAWRVAVP